ncbi:MAG: ATP synthase F1 subunit delta [Oscillospiraceae bacterium]|nr:ATP synthase F1 subunit delta [Oscillospiraceae bacterium]
MERLSVIYASALFDIAVKLNAVDDFLRQAIFLRDSISDDEFQKVLVHPQIPASEKREIFRSAFEGKIHEDLLGFLYLTADKNREAYLLPALKGLIGFIERHNKIVTAKVLSAAPYDEKQAESLKKTLSEKLSKHVELDLKVDPSLIGGPYIFVDGYYIDWTVKKKLRDLAVNLNEMKYA